MSEMKEDKAALSGREVGDREPESSHEHKWQPNGQVRVNTTLSHSPCSTWDDWIGTKVYSSMICECGEVKNAWVGNENQRRRGDDLRKR